MAQDLRSRQPTDAQIEGAINELEHALDGLLYIGYTEDEVLELVKMYYRPYSIAQLLK